MPDWLYETGNGWVFLLVTVIMGGSAAFLSGRAIAHTWRAWWHIPLYMLPLTGTVRFFHYALFHEPFLPLQNFVVDFLVLLASALFGYRALRARQMAQQYHWLFRRAGLLGWRRLA
jgi:hypothetical protein